MRRHAFRLSLGLVAACAFVAACGWDPSRPFEREAPQVKEAIGRYDAGEAGAAAELLEEYLLTGACNEGNIGTPNRLNEKPNGTFDLGLALFKIGEGYGQRFGDEESDGGLGDPNLKGLRSGMVECALRIVRKISEDASQPVSLRARARYLEGNLLFLTAAYQEAVAAYDKALELAPGMGDAGPAGASDASLSAFKVDPVGRDAAWNRAVALRRIEDKKDAGSDASNNDGGGEGGADGGGDGGAGDAGGDSGQDGGGGDGDDGGRDGGRNDQDDAGKDSGGDPPKQDPKNDDGRDAGAPPPPSRQSQDERILDQLENAPTVQQEAAKKQAAKRRVRGMADK